MILSKTTQICSNRKNIIIFHKAGFFTLLQCAFDQPEKMNIIYYYLCLSKHYIFIKCSININLYHDQVCIILQNYIKFFYRINLDYYQ